MIKKICYLGLMIFVLVGCQSSNEFPEETSPISQNKNSNLADAREVAYPESLLHVVNENIENRLTLIDLLTNEVLNEFDILVDQEVLTIQKLINGYYGILLIEGIEIGDGWFTIHSDMDLLLTLLVLDGKLNLVQSVEITDEYLISDGLFSVSISNEQESLKIYYLSGNRIYYYDVNTRQTNLVSELDEMYLLLNLEVISHNYIAFLGEHVNNPSLKYFGVINLETGEIQSHQLDFPALELIVQGHYLLLTENVPPAFAGGVPNGDVVVFNFISGEYNIIQLESYESTQAIVVDNRYVLTGSHKIIRLYDIVSNELVLEQELTIEMTINEETQQYPHIHEFLAISERLYAVVFDLGSEVEAFHVEFVRIER